MQRIRGANELALVGYDSSDGAYRVHRLVPGEPRGEDERRHGGYVRTCGWCPDGRFYALGNETMELRVFDRVQRGEPWTCAGSEVLPLQLAVARGGTLVAWTVWAEDTGESAVYVASKSATTPRKVLDVCPSFLSFTMDGTGLWCISLGRAEYVQLDGRTRTTVPLPSERTVRPVAYASDGALLLSGEYVTAVSLRGPIGSDRAGVACDFTRGFSRWNARRAVLWQNERSLRPAQRNTNAVARAPRRRDQQHCRCARRYSFRDQLARRNRAVVGGA